MSYDKKNTTFAGWLSISKIYIILVSKVMFLLWLPRYYVITVLTPLVDLSLIYSCSNKVVTACDKEKKALSDKTANIQFSVQINIHIYRQRRNTPDLKYAHPSGEI